MAFNNNRNGFENEFDICFNLNRKKLKELNILYKEFIEDLFLNVKDDDIIICYCDSTKKKYDTVIKINTDIKRVSIKKE